MYKSVASDKKASLISVTQVNIVSINPAKFYIILLLSATKSLFTQLEFVLLNTEYYPLSANA